jgi:hypothetical protein
MPKYDADVGRAALAAALARAGKRASTAAVIAAAIPLSTMAASSSAQASIVPACTGSNICDNGSNVTAGSGGVFNYNYNFASGPSANRVTSFEIPEVHAGEFLTGSGGFFGSIPSGWFVTETSTGTAPFKAPNAGVTPGAYLDVIFGGEGASFGFGSSFNMTLESVHGAFIAATVVGTFAEGGNWEIDPPTPGPVSTPEPASLALLGSAVVAAAAIRRRRKS